MTDYSDRLQERNEQALNDIRQLQEYEQQLYANLEDPNLSTEEKQTIIMRINEMSQMRMNLYSSIKNMYGNYQDNVSFSQNTIDQQMDAIYVLEEELDRTKLRMNALEAEKQNKLRVVEINDYYGKRFQAHKRVAITIFILCIPIIILSVMANAGILPQKLYTFLVVIVIVIGIVRIGYLMIDMSNRSNMNWDEYVWRFDKSKAPTDTTDASSKKNPWATKSIACIGAECCTEGNVYDEAKNQCVTSTNTNTNTTAETFAGMAKYATPTTETFYAKTQTNKVNSATPGTLTKSIYVSV